MTSSEMQRALAHVTPDSLAEHCGLAGDGHQNPLVLEYQLAFLQRNPSHRVITSEFCAKYLPALIDAYNAEDAAFSVHMRMLNIISYLPYFAKLLSTPAGSSICATQSHRMATENLDTADPAHITEMCQFLSTLLALQDMTSVSGEDKQILLSKLREWNRVYEKQQITRCLKQLEGDPETTFLARNMKQHCERALNECGFEGCQKKSGASKLLQCARCKSAVYCDRDHQKKAWPLHKATCFPTAY